MVEDCERSTIIQYAKVQGWPEWAAAMLPDSRKEAMDLIANSVPPQMVAAALEVLHEARDGEEEGAADSR